MLQRQAGRRAGVFPTPAALILPILFWSATATSFAQPAAFREYDVKAGFIYNFGKFVEWPPDAFPDEKSPIVIGILGEDPFGPVIDELVSGSTVQARPLEVKRYARVEDAVKCQILFISQSERPRLGEILRKLSDKPVLTVADTGRFLRLGGIINLSWEGRRIQLDVNQSAADKAGLKISAQLLKLATVVREQPPPSPP